MLVAVSAILLVLSFPNFNFEFLAWIALLPLLLALEKTGPLKSFLLSYLAGILFFLGTVYWLIHVTLPGMIAVALYLALYFGIFGLAVSHMFRRQKEISRPLSFILLFGIPAAWVALEWIRSHILSGFGWCLLGHSQSLNLPVIQMADVTGAYGVSFLIVIVNTSIFLTIKELKKRDYYLLSFGIAMIIVFFCVAYGTYRLRNIFTGETLKVAVVQGNIPQAKKWDENFRNSIMDKYEALTNLAGRQGADLIIWPETSVPGFMDTEPDLEMRVRSLAGSIHTPLLVGAPREGERGSSYYNSAFLVGADGSVIERYDKIHLVPFGEYVPAKWIFSFIENFAPSPIGDFAPGKRFTVFNFFVKRSANYKNLNIRSLKKARFSCLICFEDIFPDLTREFVKRGAVFFVNMTNDAWFGKTSAAYQHAQASVFRAVENRVNVVRATNTGYSCFIDQKGRITAAVESNGESLFVDGFKIHDIVLTNTRTFYTLHGDLFAYICMLLTIAFLLPYPHKFLSRLL